MHARACRFFRSCETDILTASKNLCGASQACFGSAMRREGESNTFFKPRQMNRGEQVSIEALFIRNLLQQLARDQSQHSRSTALTITTVFTPTVLPTITGPPQASNNERTSRLALSVVLSFEHQGHLDYGSAARFTVFVRRESATSTRQDASHKATHGRNAIRTASVPFTRISYDRAIRKRTS